MKTVNKKGFAFVTILLIISIAALPIIDSRTINVRKKEAFFQDEAELSINKLETSSHYDYGFKAGKLLKMLYMFRVKVS